VNNINALLFSTSVIGLPIQQEQSNSQPINNFNNLLNNLFIKENDVEISSIIQKINSNPEIMKCIYEAIATLNVYGQLNEVATSNINEIKNNQIVNYVLQSNDNLSSDEKQTILNGIKIISEQIIKNNSSVSIQVPSKNHRDINRQLNLFSTKDNVSLNNVLMDFESNNNAVNPANVETNKIINKADNNDLVQKQITQTIQFLPSPLQNNSKQIINNKYVDISLPVNNVNNNEEQTIITTNIPYEIDNNIEPETNISYVDFNSENLIKIKNQITDIVNLLSGITIDKNNKPLLEEIAKLNNYVKELDAIVGRINISNVSGSEQLKNMSIEISRIVNSIFVSLINATAYLNNGNVNNNESGLYQGTINPTGKFNKGNDYTNSDVMQNSTLLYTEKENDFQNRELINKIIFMLKEMNGELYLNKKVEFVYKPFSNQSSQVTPEGTLLINTADVKNFKEFFDVNFKLILNDKTSFGTNNNGNNNDVLVKAENSSNVQNAVSVNTIKDVTSNPVSITHSYDVPKTFQISKDNVNQTIINTINKNYQSNLKNVIDEVNTYFINYIENKSEQMSVNTKIFEKVMDFSNKVKDSMVIKQIVNNVTDAIKYTTSEKIEVKMMLKPENLGPVIIKFETKDNVINGRIDVASTITRDIIKANMVELRNSLNNLGYNVENFEVSMLNTYTSGNSQGNLNYYNGQEIQLPVHINNEIIEDIGIIADSQSYLNYLA